MKNTLFIFLMLLPVIYTAAQNKGSRWVKENFYRISTDPENDDFSDLQFLKKEIGSKTIVAIGEQTHEDGKSFEARSRLIQFLVEEMSFEVILFESGMFDVSYGAELYKETDSIQYLSNSLMSAWRDVEQHNKLFEYIHENNKLENPLLFGGFDCKFTSKYRKRYVGEIDKALISCKADLTHTDYKKYRNIVRDFANARGIRSALPKLNKRAKKDFLVGSQWVQNMLEEAKHPFLQTIRSYDKGIAIYSELSLLKILLAKKKLYALNNQRDRLMAENLNYVLENDFKNKKVILFGATYHFIRNNHLILPNDKLPVPVNESTVMGDLLEKKYLKDIYVIGFTAYEGTYGEVEKGNSGEKIEPAKEGSLEHIIVKSDLKDGMLLLDPKEEKPEWWYSNLTLRLFLYESLTACEDWSEVLDAIFFIKEMEPCYKN